MRPTRAWRVPPFLIVPFVSFRSFPFVPLTERSFLRNNVRPARELAIFLFFFNCLVCFNPFFPLKERSFPSNEDQYYTIDTCFDGLGKWLLKQIQVKIP